MNQLVNMYKDWKRLKKTEGLRTERLKNFRTEGSVPVQGLGDWGTGLNRANPSGLSSYIKMLEYEALIPVEFWVADTEGRWRSFLQ